MLHKFIIIFYYKLFKRMRGSINPVKLFSLPIIDSNFDVKNVLKNFAKSNCLCQQSVKSQNFKFRNFFFMI